MQITANISVLQDIRQFHTSNSDLASLDVSEFTESIRVLERQRSRAQYLEEAAGKKVKRVSTVMDKLLRAELMQPAILAAISRPRLSRGSSGMEWTEIELLPAVHLKGRSGFGRRLPSSDLHLGRYIDTAGIVPTNVCK